MRKALLFLLFAVCLLSFTACSSQTDPENTDATDLSGTTAQTDPEIPEITTVKTGAMAPGSYYINMLTDSAADPVILLEGDTYYLYSTGNTSLSVRTSKNLINWSATKTILRLADFPWASNKCWAPEVYKYNDKYYLLLSAARADGIHSIDVAVCDTPDGMFKPLNSEPMFAPEYSVIDGSLLFEDDRIYMYYSKDCSTNIIGGKHISQIYGVEVKTDFSGIIGEPVMLSTPTKSWETVSGNYLWNEGPMVIHENGKYYLLYSANYYQNSAYSVGYAIAESPLGPYTKPSSNRLLSYDGGKMSGPGHCYYFRSADGTEVYLCYHCHTVAPTSEKGRSLCIDRLIFNEDGSLYVDGPSTTARPFPSGTAGYVKIHDGFKVEVDEGNITYGKTDTLFDGKILRSYTSALTVKDGTEITITFDEPTSLYSIWVYGGDSTLTTPDHFDLLINDRYLIDGRSFSEIVSKPTSVYLGNLPDDTLISTMKITLYGGEDNIPKSGGEAELMLTEIIMVTKEEK